MWSFQFTLSVLACFVVCTKGIPVSSKCEQFGLHNHGNPNCANQDAEPTKVAIGDNYERRMKRESPDALFGDPVGDIASLLSLKSRGQKGDTCKSCKTAIGLVKFLALNNKSEEELLQLATTLCMDMNVMTKPLCEGLLKINGHPLHTRGCYLAAARAPRENQGFLPKEVMENNNKRVFVQKTATNLLELTHFAAIVSKIWSPSIPSTLAAATELCSFLVKFDCDGDLVSEQEWRVDIPAGISNELSMAPKSENPSKPLKVLHISDTHFDPHYEEGVPDVCPLPLCCRAETGNVSQPTSLSGKWGGWKCDIPERTLDNLLEHISQEHGDIDYVIWTGDIPPHDAWSMEKDESLSILNKTVAKILKTFPNIPVYPALGNHEAVPPNLFPPSSVGDRWSVDYLYNEVERQWSHWLPENSTGTIRRGAFYTVLNRPRLRIVSLNTNFCYYANWWLILNSTDPEQELKWLVDVLQQAEENGEKVQIIGHIPPGHKDCLKAWQTNYYDIIQRFSRTVVGQFFGHTHTDEFEIFYDRKKPQDPVNVAYIAPSITTYTYLNPGYRVYYIEGDHEESSRAVLDHDTWYMDLEEANQMENPTWKKLYSAKEAFNMTSLSPTDWHEVYTRMTTNDELFDAYDRFFWSNSRKRTNCDAECKKARLCGIRSCAQYGTVEAASEVITETTTA